jgi:hypothetical protein
MMNAPSSQVTSRRYTTPFRPRPVRFANVLGELLQKVGVRTSLAEESLVRAAQRETGLSFFGEESFRVPMRVALHSLETEARLHPVGRFMARAVLARNLANRLRLQALRDRQPEIFQIDVERPVFIVGLQRTGTTFLQRMLARHPSLRSLTSWEATNPVPFHEKRVPAGAPDPRIRMAQLVERGVRYMAPDFFAIHPIVADGEEEDSLIFDPSFFTTTIEALANIPTFTRWLIEADDRKAYEDYRELIQVLLSQRGGRWIGKTPFHLEHLGTLLATFPDAKIIYTHRDPVQTVGSLCSMLAHARGFFSDHVDPHEVGRQWLARTALMVEKGLADRARFDPGIFLDLRYEDLIADPLKEIERVSSFIDAPLDEGGQRAIRAFQRNNPQHMHGRHGYALEDFGLREEQVAERFRGYRERFDLGPAR